MNRLSLVLASASFVSTLLGCTPTGEGAAHREKTFPATGVVTLDGVPVAGATVTFQSPTLTAYGRTDDKGKFALTTYDQDDGAPAGDYVVTIKKVERVVVKESTNPAMPSVTEDVWHLPKKLAETGTSGLTKTVAADGENVFEFPLESS